MAGNSAGGSGLSSNVISILSWSFLPSFLANTLLTIFYRLFPSSRPTVPARATAADVALANARAQAHHRRARVALIASHLVYSVLSLYLAQARGVEQNYYALLGIAREVVERDGASAVKSHWRRLARVYHPDKVGKGGEEFFVLLRKGVEVLENDQRRWAYERFGPQVTEWGKLVAMREFLVKGAVQAAVFWVFAAVSIAAFTFFRKSERRYNFWRYLTLALCLSLEYHLLLRSTPSPTFSFFFPRRLPYEHTALLRQLFISTSMAMSQLAPLLFPTPPPLSSEQDAHARALADAEQLAPLLQRLARLTATAEAETAALQSLELRPLLALPPLPAGEARQADEERKLREEVKGHMVRVFEDLQVKSQRGTAEVWADAVRKGRERERKRREREAGGQGKVGAEKQPDAAKEQRTGEAEAKEGKEKAKVEPVQAPFSTSEEPVADPPSPSLPALDSAAIPPPNTALASPPASPKMGFPVAAISLSPAPSPSLDGEVLTQDAAQSLQDSTASKSLDGGEKEEKELLQPPPSRDDFRLPSPPPDD
ncbi:uncharacterized protein JCM10292_004364 [Rhodotorula paludigena]|uniref:uncharacterized protein n=1 Tax=Rhodotorula paludigena TaxID=86838 RepID=UPI0031785982